MANIIFGDIYPAITSIFFKYKFITYNFFTRVWPIQLEIFITTYKEINENNNKNNLIYYIELYQYVSHI